MNSAGQWRKACNQSNYLQSFGEGYWYLQMRKKGLLHAKDLKYRVKFCRKVRKKKLETNSGEQVYHFIWMRKDFSTKVTLMTRHVHHKLGNGENGERV